MNIERLNINGTDIAVISSDGQVISGTQSALDLAMTVKYEAGTGNIAISKGLICEDFFVLNTGMAGEILQKFVNPGSSLPDRFEKSCKSAPVFR